MNTDLALLGGGKVIVDPFVRHNPIGPEELEAATQVIQSGRLSPFLGAWVTDGESGSFFGGRHGRAAGDARTAGMIGFTFPAENKFP